VQDVRKDVLLVDLDRERLVALERALAFRAQVDTCADFARARTRLIARPPELLVTHSHLGEYNGLQLAHLAAALTLPTRVVVHGEAEDLALARETQIAGAFYVPRQQIAVALPAYLDAELPPQDRRDVAHRAYRQQFRDGRRATDLDARLAS
jgi:DNA-binding NtrC family response regulator